jgi:hypothetical protein
VPEEATDIVEYAIAHVTGTATPFHVADRELKDLGVTTAATLQMVWRVATEACATATGRAPDWTAIGPPVFQNPHLTVREMSRILVRAFGALPGNVLPPPPPPADPAEKK